MKRPRLQRVPSGVVELLRLFVVVFFAGIGSLIGSQFDLYDTPFEGMDGALLGVVVGSFIGYALGGVLGRSTVAAVDRTEERLRSVSAETIVGGVFGGLVGVFFGVALAWPIFFIGTLALSIPIFGFAVVALGLLGFRVGATKRDSMIGMFGARAGMAPPAKAASAYPKILDTSVAIDGRILDVVRAGFLHGQIYITTPVIGELQGFADAGDELRRSKGRRGLEVLETLKREPGVEVVVHRRRGSRRARGGRQARASGDRQGRRTAHARHQPGEGRGYRRCSRPESSRVGVGASAPCRGRRRGHRARDQDRQGARTRRRLPRRWNDGRGRTRTRVRRSRAGRAGHERAYDRERTFGVQPSGRGFWPHGTSRPA